MFCLLYKLNTQTAESHHTIAQHNYLFCKITYLFSVILSLLVSISHAISRHDKIVI